MRVAPLRCLSAAAMIVLAFAGQALAEEGAGGVYKCTAENGAVTYSTSPCKGAKREFLSKEKLEGKISTIEFPKPEAAKPEPSTPEPSTASEKAPAASAAAATPAAATPTAATVAPPTTPVANPKIRTLPIERKLKKD